MEREIKFITTNIPVANAEHLIDINPDTNIVYITNNYLFDNIDTSVSVIDGSRDELTNITIPVGDFPSDIAINPDTNKVYVTSEAADTVSVIDGEINQINFYYTCR